MSVPKVAKYKKKIDTNRFSVFKLLTLYMADFPKIILPINEGLTSCRTTALVPEDWEQWLKNTHSY